MRSAEVLGAARCAANAGAASTAPTGAGTSRAVGSPVTAQFDLDPGAHRVRQVRPPREEFPSSQTAWSCSLIAKSSNASVSTKYIFDWWSFVRSNVMQRGLGRAAATARATSPATTAQTEPSNPDSQSRICRSYTPSSTPAGRLARLLKDEPALRLVQDRPARFRPDDLVRCGAGLALGLEGTVV